MDLISQFIENYKKKLNFYAVENCGLDGEHIYNNIDEMEHCGYFTVFVVKK